MEILKGERKRIIRKIGNSVPVTYQFKAEPLSAQDTLSGTVEVSGSNWIFSKQPVLQKLEADNSVGKGYWDTFYSIYVTPDCNVKITFNQAGVSKIFPLLLGAGLVVVVAISLVIAMLI